MESMPFYTFSLTPQRFMRWRTQALKNICALFAALLLGLLLACYLWWQAQHYQQQSARLQSEADSAQQQLAQLDQQLAQLRANSPNSAPSLSGAQLMDFLTLLRHAPAPQGGGAGNAMAESGLQSAQLYLQGGNMQGKAQGKLIGQFGSEQAFEQLVGYLKAQQRTVELGYFQLNDAQQFEFSLTVE